MNNKYIPVSCDLVDLIEIEATRKNLVSIELNLNGTEAQLTSRIKTWVTEGTVEYLITENNLKIRLDHIHKFNNTAIEKNCIIRTYQ